MQLEANLATWNATIKAMKDSFKLEEFEINLSDGTRRTVWKVNRPKPDIMETVDFVSILRFINYQLESSSFMIYIYIYLSVSRPLFKMEFHHLCPTELYFISSVVYKKIANILIMMLQNNN